LAKHFDQSLWGRENESMLKTKVMLVLESPEDMDFLLRVLENLGLEVIIMQKGEDLSEKLIDYFPDVVFASTLGRNEQILSTLGKIKRVRGKPRLVYIRSDRDNAPLSVEQRKIIDGVLYSPIDPLRLLDVVASTSNLDISELRERYKKIKGDDSDRMIRVKAPESEGLPSTSSNMISDQSRREKYKKICDGLIAQGHGQLNTQVLRQKQKQQSQDLSPDVEHDKKKKQFVKALFSAKPVGKS
jgi:response regulator RpfG family c-di-GMP phosphodiesterase